jgi:hypothetical protein
MSVGQETSAESSSLAHLKNLVQLYETRQAKSAAHSMLASVGVGLIAVAIGTGLIAAWTYYGDSIASIPQTKMAVEMLQSKLDSLGDLKTQLASTESKASGLDARFNSLETQLGEFVLDRLEFFATRSASLNGMADTDCPSPARLIGGSCLATGGDNSRPSFGVKFFPESGSSALQRLNCQRYANEPVQAIAICVRPKAASR